MKREKEIDPRELLYYVLKKWRVIIIVGIALALIAGACKLVSGIRNNISYEADPNAEEREMLQVELDELQKTLDQQVDYNENSVLMKVDPLDEYVGSFQVFVDANYQIDTSSSVQNADITPRLVRAYESFLTSGELYAYVLNNTDTNDDITDIKYISEIIQVEADPTAASVYVRCISDNEERAQDMVNAVTKAVNERYGEVMDIVGDHKCSIIMDSVYPTIDRELEEAQVENYLKVGDSQDKVEKKKAEIDALGNPNELPPEISMKQAVISAVKDAIVGGIVGVVLAFVLYGVLGILTRKMWSTTGWNNCGIAVLGDVSAEEKQRKFAKVDRWFAKLTNFYEPEKSIEASEALAAANISAILKKKNAPSAAVVSMADKKLCADIVDGMNKSANVFSFAGNVISESDAVERLDEVNDVVLLAENEKITVDEVAEIVKRLDAWGKNLLGVIVIK